MLLSRSVRAVGPLAVMASAMSGKAMAIPNIVLNDGRQHPIIGYGTYKVGVIPASASSAVAKADAAVEAANPTDCVKQALECGYRFLDCAEFYANEEAVGDAIAESGVHRSELYLASKVWTTTIHQGPEAVQAQIDKTLAALKTDYLDLYCIHWPVPGKHVAAYQQLEKAQKAGQIRSLGVSNYAYEDLTELMATATVVPAINQIEINPFLYRKNTIAAFEAKGVRMQSYRALRDGKAFDDPTVVRVASKHAVTPAQVLGRWCVQKGFIYIPKSVKKERMLENKDVLSFELDADDIAALDALTTPEAIAKFRELYTKCVVRDTPDADRAAELAKKDITID